MLSAELQVTLRDFQKKLFETHGEELEKLASNANKTATTKKFERLEMPEAPAPPEKNPIERAIAEGRYEVYRGDNWSLGVTGGADKDGVKAGIVITFP